MALIAAGVSFRTAPLHIREKLVVSPSDAPAALAELRSAGGVREAVLLSTCNRTEFYFVEGETGALPAVWELLSNRLEADVIPYGYVHRDRDAAAHLFRVAAGMDSMILGEAQIHGQVRDAWETSREHSGVALNRVFQTALYAAARVRSETAIGHGAASVASAAVQLGKQIFGSLRGRRAMVLGAGGMAELSLQCLVNEGVRAAMVANRTFERARELARIHGATALHFEECWRQLHEVDLVICSTAAPRAVVTAELVRPTLAARGDRPLCILDIALPRDVDPAVGALANVFLYDLDNLRAVAAATLERRQGELPSAEGIITSEVERYWAWLAGLSAVPVVTQFRAEMDRLREQELAQVLRRLGSVSPEDRQTIEHFSRVLMNKFLHGPSVRLRAAAANGRGLDVVDATRYLFGLDDAGGAPASSSPAQVEPSSGDSGDES